MGDPDVVDTDEEEEEEQEGFFEWLSGKVSSSKVAKKAYNASSKLASYGQWCGLVGLKVTWVVLSSTVIVGIPYMLAVDGESSVIEMQKQMTAQQGMPSGAVGAGGMPVAARTVPMPLFHDRLRSFDLTWIPTVPCSHCSRVDPTNVRCQEHDV